MKPITKQNLILKGNINAFWLDKDGNIKRKENVKNLVVYSGIETFFKRLAQEYADDCYITHAALGDDDTAATTGDTTLGNEVYRNGVINMTASGNVLYVDALFELTEVSGTFKEFGFVIDGDTQDKLFNRVIVNWTKTTAESLFIRSTFTITNV